MAITTNDTITWSELITKTKNNLLSNIENLSGASIPNELNGTDLTIATVNQTHADWSGQATVHAISERNWSTVTPSVVEQDFDNFLTFCGINTDQRANQLVSTRLILNFFENVSLFYTNRLVIVYSPFGSKPKKLFYYNNGSNYSTWSGKVNNIESPVADLPIGNTEINTIMLSLNNNLKNKIKTYEQTYNFYSTSCSCSSSCSSCSSCSSSSSCCSCLTIVHQDLSML